MISWQLLSIYTQRPWRKAGTWRGRKSDLEPNLEYCYSYEVIAQLIKLLQDLISHFSWRALQTVIAEPNVNSPANIDANKDYMW